MKKFRKISSIAALSLSTIFAIGSVAVLAQTSNQDNSQQTVTGEKRNWRSGSKFGKQHRRGGKMSGMMFANLNLSEDQKEQMKQIHQKFRQNTQSVRQQLRAKQQELREAENGATFNEGLATQKLMEMASLQAKLMSGNFNLRQEMLGVLTAEQKTQLEQARAERKAKLAERKANRQSRPDNVQIN